MECVNCRIREGLYENNRWCSKCSIVHKKEPIVKLPSELFIFYILPHLSLMDIRDLSEVSKEMNDYMNQPNVWRSVYQMSMGSKYYQKLLHRLSNSSHKKVTQDITILSCTYVVIVIHNTTTDIPFDIYHIREKSRSNAMVPRAHKYNLLPGKSFTCKTFHGHMWTCIPTEKWLRSNPVSNVGSMFVADLDQRMWMNPQIWSPEYGPESPARLIHLHQINKPKCYHNIKGVNKVYSNYKREFLRLIVDPSRLISDRTSNKEMMEQTRSEIKNLYGIINGLEKRHRDLVIKDHHYTEMTKILS